MAGIAGLMLLSGPAAGAPPAQHQFHVVMTVDIDADLDSSLINIKRNNTNNPVIFQLCTPNCVEFTLNLDFWAPDPFVDIYANGADGRECFPEAAVQGAVHLSERRNGDAQAAFWFTGKADDGDADNIVKYLLILTDTDGWDGTFPTPNIGIGNSIEMNADFWEMQTEGKGKLRRVACKGMGANPDEANIVLTRTS